MGDGPGEEQHMANRQSAAVVELDRWLTVSVVGWPRPKLAA
jgi:hypothetical protein